MSAKTKKQLLREHAKAVRDIEFAEVAIGILETIGDCGSLVRTLKRKQQTFLRRIDKAAAELGAPYGI